MKIYLSIIDWVIRLRGTYGCNKMGFFFWKTRIISLYCRDGYHTFSFLSMAFDLYV